MALMLSIDHIENSLIINYISCLQFPFRMNFGTCHTFHSMQIKPIKTTMSVLILPVKVDSLKIVRHCSLRTAFHIIHKINGIIYYQKLLKRKPENMTVTFSSYYIPKIAVLVFHHSRTFCLP